MNFFLHFSLCLLLKNLYSQQFSSLRLTHFREPFVVDKKNKNVLDKRQDKKKNQSKLTWDTGFHTHSRDLFYVFIFFYLFHSLFCWMECIFGYTWHKIFNLLCRFDFAFACRVRFRCQPTYHPTLTEINTTLLKCHQHLIPFAICICLRINNIKFYILFVTFPLKYSGLK